MDAVRYAEFVAQERGVLQAADTWLRTAVELFVWCWSDAHGAAVAAQPAFPARSYLKYTAAVRNTKRGQTGWKLIFAWGIAMDGHSPEVAARVEDMAVRTHEALRDSYDQFLWSDAGHERYVLKRWRSTFQSLYKNLPASDRKQIRDSRQPKAAKWIPPRR